MIKIEFNIRPMKKLLQKKTQHISNKRYFASILDFLRIVASYFTLFYFTYLYILHSIHDLIQKI